MYCTGIGFAAPVSVIGSRPPRRPRASAPNSASGSVTRPIGRLAQARVAGEGRGDVGRRHRAHDQPHAGAGVAAVDHVLGLLEAADADAVARATRPARAARPSRRRPASPGRCRARPAPSSSPVIRVSPTASAPEDQRPVRDRLVARHLRRAARAAPPPAPASASPRPCPAIEASPSSRRIAAPLRRIAAHAVQGRRGAAASAAHEGQVVRPPPGRAAPWPRSGCPASPARASRQSGAGGAATRQPAAAAHRRERVLDVVGDVGREPQLGARRHRAGEQRAGSPAFTKRRRWWRAFGQGSG